MINVVELLFDTQITAEAWSKYVDLQGYDEVTFVVRQSGNTASSGNTFTPTIQVASASPTSQSSYSAASTDQINGSFTAHTSTGDKAPETASFTPGPNDRYAAVKLTETGTADFDMTVYAILSRGRHQPISGDTPATGTPA